MKPNIKAIAYSLFSIILFLLIMYILPEGLIVSLKRFFGVDPQQISRLRSFQTAIIPIILLSVSAYFVFQYLKHKTRVWPLIWYILAIFYSTTFFLIVQVSYPDDLTMNLKDFFNLDGETNFPAWVSTLLLFSVSLIAFLLFTKHRLDFHARKYYATASIVFLFLSLDEYVSIHEKLDFLIGKWIFIYAPVALVFFIFNIYSLKKIGNNKLRNRILSGLIIYASGAMVCESISYAFNPLPLIIQEIEIIAEEVLEMTGCVIILLGFIIEFDKTPEFSFKPGTTLKE